MQAAIVLRNLSGTGSLYRWQPLTCITGDDSPSRFLDEASLVEHRHGPNIKGYYSPNNLLRITKNALTDAFL